jgi:hypothetical protein
VYAFAHLLDFLDLAKKARFQIRNWRCLHPATRMETSLGFLYQKITILGKKLYESLGQESGMGIPAGRAEAIRKAASTTAYF